MSDRRVFIGSKPGLRLESVRWKEDAQLLVLLLRGRGHLYMHVCPSLPLGPAQLNLYEPANRDQNAAYSEQKEEPR
jgi:hypothetical protein